MCCSCNFPAVLLFRPAEARPQKKTAGKKRSAGDRIDDNVTAAFATILAAFLSAGGQPAAVPHERGAKSYWVYSLRRAIVLVTARESDFVMKKDATKVAIIRAALEHFSGGFDDAVLGLDDHEMDELSARLLIKAKSGVGVDFS